MRKLISSNNIMGKVILVCGKIGCGKSYYANYLKQKERAIILSCDEVTNILFDNNLGSKHDAMSQKIQQYLLEKSVELVKVGCNVILDWGFWTVKGRQDVRKFYRSQNIACEWHYIDVDEQTWQRNIKERNRQVLAGKGGSAFYIDAGLLEKMLSQWEVPNHEEINVWYTLKR